MKVRRTLEMARAADGVAQDDAILVSSFNLASLVYAHQCAPQFEASTPGTMEKIRRHGANYCT